MSYDSSCLKEEFDPFKKLYEYLKYQYEFKKEHPFYFEPDGLILFVGMQGKGKTLSAVLYVYQLMKKYPKAKLVTNLMLKDYPIITFEEWYQSKMDPLEFLIYLKKNDKEKEKIFNENFIDYQNECRVFPFHNQDDLQRYSNGEEGVIYLIDEIQLYFNSLESKNINPEVMAQISQQRKQRKHIVATSQVFGRMAKPLREQFSNVVVCNSYFRFLQCNKVVNRDDIEEGNDDMHVQGRVCQKSWFIHTPMYYKRYDTSYIINRTKFVGNEKKVRESGHDTRAITTNN